LPAGDGLQWNDETQVSWTQRSSTPELAAMTISQLIGHERFEPRGG
jgi:hypothetical protein